MKHKNKSRFYVFCVTVIALLVMVSAFANDVIKNMNLGLDLRGGFEIVYEVTPLEEGQELPSMTVVVASIRKRIDILGVNEPEIVIEGDNRIRVQLAGVTSQDEARTVISSTANLTFRDTNDKLLMDATVLSEGGASLQYQDGKPVVSLKIKDKETFYQVTSDLAKQSNSLMITWLDFNEETDSYEKEYAKVLKGENPSYISAATVNSGINGDAVISGAFTEDEARTLANLINSGSLPVKLTEISSNVVSAELGVSAYEQTMVAGGIGILLVMLFMVLVYRLPGAVSAVVLPVYVFAVLGIYRLMGGVFTLPGIAALVLGVGMTVDSNIITFERIKEELRLGRSVEAACLNGQKMSLRTIADAQLTTFIAAFVMYLFGTGAVKGFATMLMVTLFCTAFVSILLVRFLMTCIAKSGLFADKKTWFCVKMSEIPNVNKGETKAYENPFYRLDFVKIAKYFVGFSIAVLVVALLTVGFHAANGKEPLNLGIDFASGTKITVIADDTLDVKEVTAKFKEFGYEPSRVQLTGEGNTSAHVTIKQAIEQEQLLELKADLYEYYGHEASDSVVTPIVGRDLVKNAIYLTLLAWACMLVYISVRFEWDYAIGCIVALIHDVAMVFSVFVIFNFEINSNLIAVFLAIIGYSINNSIVVFDFIREAMKEKDNVKLNAKELFTLVNHALADTFTRSIYSTTTTLLPILALLILGSESIFTFNFAMLVGLIFGAYSSLFIAAQVWCRLRLHAKPKKEKKKKKRKKEDLEEYIVPGINDIR
ncbi:MAG: protein translocase subunit SecD [Erysipelotrichaceae bacterium]|nr:protein translocase subunit SecD [Erysipelotrichaceae bacterium]